MFLAKDGDESSRWHMVAKEGQIEVLHKVWEWAKWVLTQEELKHILSQR
jgi:hypothetical protein